MKRIIIDTDTGVDDALAIILGLNSPELRVEGITTVAGNVEVKKCTRNCLLLLDWLQPANPPIVAQGAEKPLRRDLGTAPEVHGEDGLGNVTKDYPSPRHRAVKETATQAILELVRKYPRKITIVAIGPLTNLALAVQKDLKTMRETKEIIAMGGAFQVPGNTGPVAEFNMFVDPDAAQQILDSALPLTLLPLDVTEQVELHRHEILRRKTRGRKEIGALISKFTRIYMEYHKETRGFSGSYLHDPLAVGVAIRRSLVRSRNLRVDVETRGRLTRGMTVAHPYSSRENPSRQVSVAYEVRTKEFLKLFTSRVWN